MVLAADINAARGGRTSHLGVAAEAEVGISCNEHLGVDRAVRGVATGAAFPKSRMFENDGLGLFPVALRARLVQPGHGEASGRFEDVQAVRIVALDAIHLPLEDGVVLREGKLGMRFQMALKAGLGIPAWVDDKLAATASDRHVFAGGPVAGFATILAVQPGVFEPQTRMGAGREDFGDVCVTILAGLVPNERCAVDLREDKHRPLDGGAGGD